MKPRPFVKSIIELNGPSERVELGLLILIAPLWGIVFPLVGLSMLISYCGVTLLLASFFCFLHFLHLTNSKFSFEAEGLRLPGVDHRLLPYGNLKRIHLHSTRSSVQLLAADFRPLKSVFTRRAVPEPALIQQAFEIRYLTVDSARQLLEALSSKLDGCEISSDARELLANWKPNAVELKWNAQSDLKKRVRSCLARCCVVSARIWLIGWVIVALIFYPVSISDMLYGSSKGAQFLTNTWEKCCRVQIFLFREFLRK